MTDVSLPYWYLYCLFDFVYAVLRAYILWVSFIYISEVMHKPRCLLYFMSLYNIMNFKLIIPEKKNVFVLHQMTDHPDSYNRIIPRNQCAVFWAWESLKIKISKQQTKNIRWIKNVKNIHISVLYKKKERIICILLWMFNVHCV